LAGLKPETNLGLGLGCKPRPDGKALALVAALFEPIGVQLRTMSHLYESFKDLNDLIMTKSSYEVNPQKENLANYMPYGRAALPPFN